jgi:hypothetical protein
MIIKTEKGGVKEENLSDKIQYLGYCNSKYSGRVQFSTLQKSRHLRKTLSGSTR